MCHKALSLDMCMLSSKNSETNSHLFLHCEMAWQLFYKPFPMFGISWVCLASLDSFLSTRYCGVGRNKEKKNTLWEVARLAVLWCYGWKGMLESLNNYISGWRC